MAADNLNAAGQSLLKFLPVASDKGNYNDAVDITTIISQANGVNLTSSSSNITASTVTASTLKVTTTGKITLGADGYLNQPSTRVIILGTTTATGLLDIQCAANAVINNVFRYETRGAGNYYTNAGPEVQIGIAIANLPSLVAGQQQALAQTYVVGVTPFLVRGYISQTAPLLGLQQMDSTAVPQACGVIDASFNVSTHASWSGNLLLSAGDVTANRLGIQVQSNGSVALLGFFGATPVVKQTATAYATIVANAGTAMLAGSTSTGGSGSTAYTFGDVVLALKNLGFLTV